MCIRDSEYDVLGRLQQPVVHALDPETFLHTHAALDLALVAVRPLDVGGRRALTDQGYLVPVSYTHLDVYKRQR